jgi:predicted HTH transcriptional regulator
MNPSAIRIDPPPYRDHLGIEGTSIANLALDRVAEHVERAVQNGRYTGARDPQTYLLDRRCLTTTESGDLATTAGLLCFGKQPQQFFPRAVVDLGHYHGIEAVSFEVVHLEKDIGGTLFEQFARVENYLWTNTHHGMTLTERSSVRVEVHQYPRVVLRELTINVLAHREYHNFHASARVQLFRDRIEWVSPGGLPAGVTVENLLIAQFSRNPTIVRVLYDAGLVEEFGQGIDTVVATLRREGLEEPDFTDAGTFFQVGVRGRPAVQVFGAPYTQLTQRQRRILDFIRAQLSVSTPDIIQLFDQAITPRSIQRDIKILEEAGLIAINGQGRATRYEIIRQN